MQEVAENYNQSGLIDNIIDHFNVIRKRYKLILLIVFSSVLATGTISHYKPDMYQSRAVIIPVMTKDDQNSITMVDRQIGISMPTPSNVSELVSLLNSNILLEKVIKNEDIFPIFLNERLEAEPEPEKVWRGVRLLKGTYNAYYNKKDGIIELSVKFSNPKTTTDILNRMLEELTDYMSSEAKRVAETNRKYLESLINKNADPLIRQKIYSLIARQIEISMMAEVKENFAFKLIDPPRVPYATIKPSIKNDMVFSFVLSLFAGLLIAFLVEYISESRKKRGHV